jgi:hypothetical protein
MMLQPKTTKAVQPNLGSGELVPLRQVVLHRLRRSQLTQQSKQTAKGIAVPDGVGKPAAGEHRFALSDGRSQAVRRSGM